MVHCTVCLPSADAINISILLLKVIIKDSEWPGIIVICRQIIENALLSLISVGHRAEIQT